MDYLVLADVRPRHVTADPKGLASRGVGDLVVEATHLDVGLSDAFDHRHHAPLTLYVYDRAFAALPADVGSALASHKEAIPPDALESHADRDPFVAVRHITDEGGVLLKPGLPGAQQQISRALVFESGRQNSWRNGHALGEACFFAS